jgi:hypothetical protein
MSEVPLCRVTKRLKGGVAWEFDNESGFYKSAILGFDLFLAKGIANGNRLDHSVGYEGFVGSNCDPSWSYLIFRSRPRVDCVT